MRNIEARALLALSVAGEQHPADHIAFSAFLAVETYRQASVQPRKKVRYYFPLKHIVYFGVRDVPFPDWEERSGLNQQPCQARKKTYRVHLQYLLGG